MYAKSFPLGGEIFSLFKLALAILAKADDATKDGNGPAAVAAPIPDNKDRDGGEQ